MTAARRSDGIPIWGLLSAIAAPVLLIGGWTIAARLQRGGFDSIAGTISALAARDADQRWVMTSALAGLGLAHVVSSLALRPAARPGWLLLAAGGVATMVVAAAPLPSGRGSSSVHTLAATVAFSCLTLWPAAASRPAADGHLPRWPWQRRVGLSASVVLLAVLVWFFFQLQSDGDQVGLSERVVAGGQALWPLAAMIGGRWIAAGRSGTRA